MILSKRNPAAGHSGGARKTVLLTTANASEIKPSHSDHQAPSVSPLAIRDAKAKTDIASFAVSLGRQPSGSFSEIIAEHRLCALPSDDVKRRLATDGVDLAALARRWQTRPLDIPRIERVIFDGRGGFEFARYRQGVRDAGAMIFIVRNHIGDVIDLAAWGPPRPLALWIARSSMLGSENLFGFRMREALEVHPTPFEWLLAGCQGVVILDPAKAAPLLRRAEPLQASSFAHGRNLKKLLDVKPPRILVPASAERRPPT
jgi:hypothetical protein